MSTVRCVNDNVGTCHSFFSLHIFPLRTLVACDLVLSAGCDVCFSISCQCTFVSMKSNTRVIFESTMLLHIMKYFSPLKRGQKLPVKWVLQCMRNEEVVTVKHTMPPALIRLRYISACDYFEHLFNMYLKDDKTWTELVIVVPALTQPCSVCVSF